MTDTRSGPVTTVDTVFHDLEPAVVAALRAQNVQVASGVLNQPPVANPRAFQVTVRTLGRLTDANEFSSIVVKTAANAVVRLRDVADVGLDAILRHDAGRADPSRTLSRSPTSRPWTRG